MKAYLFFLLFFGISLAGNTTTWIVENSGFTFSPSTITVQQGDTVIFDLENLHTVLEVSQATWNGNGTTPLPGGFSLPLGGGTLLPSDLPVGTHYYVCEPHAFMGMKGIIIVEPTTSVDEGHLSVGVLIFPNPADERLYIRIEDQAFKDNFGLEIYDHLGRRMFAAARLDPLATQEIDISGFADGMYVLKFYAGTGLATPTDPVVFHRRIVVQ